MQEINPTGTELTMERPLRPLDVIEEFKRVGVVEGVGPTPKLKTMAETVDRVNNPFGEPHGRRMAWWPEDMKRPPAKAKLMYFVGCTSSYRQQEIARSTVRILNKLGVEFGVTPDEVCCGSHVFRSGQRDAGLRTLRKAIEAMEKAGAEVVFTGCAECYRVLKSDAPENGLEVPFEVIHTMDILKEREKELKPLLKRKWKEKVTYHDPCNLGRQMGYYETPREILSTILGLELVEMHRNKRWSWCCGAGGGVNLDFPDLALSTAEERLWEAHDVEAATIATLCPWCRWNLVSAIPAVSRWVNVKVYDITEIIWELMK
jgi:heterodisulfide reductase subunit D